MEREASRRLERRYRRLLVLYPPDHRRAYGEEMLGVLLDKAERSGPWDVAADAADLAAAALRLRYRACVRTVGDPAWPSARVRDQHWADAFAVASLVFPIALLAMAAGDLGLPQAAMRGTASVEAVVAGSAAYLTFWPLTFGAPLTAVLALLGRRRGTAVAAVATTVCLLVVMPRLWADPAAALADALGTLAGAASLLSRGPRRGLALARWWGIALVALGAFLMASVAEDSLSLYPGFPGTFSGAAATALSGIVLTVAACACVRTPPGRRFLPLMAIPAIPYALVLRDDLFPALSYLDATHDPGTWGVPGWFCLVLPVTVIAIVSIVGTKASS